MKSKTLSVNQHIALSKKLRKAATSIDDVQRICEVYCNDNHNLLHHLGKINSYYTTSHFIKVLFELDKAYQKACKDENNYDYPEDIYFQTYNLG